MRFVAKASFAFGAAACALSLLVACSARKFSSDETPSVEPAEASVPPADSGATCTTPVFVDDPSAKPDDRCGLGGAPVSLDTASDHCGACRQECIKPGGCAAGVCEPTPLLKDTNVASALISDDIAYVADGKGRVSRAPLTAAAGQAYGVAAALPSGSVRRLAKDETWLYLSTSTGPRRIALDGSGASLLKTTSSDNGGVLGIGASVYYYASTSGIEVFKKDTLEAQPSLAATGVKDLVVDGDSAYWVQASGDKSSLLGPYPKTDVLAVGPSIDAIALDVEYIYYGDSKSRQINRVPRRGGRSQRVAAEPGKSIVALALDGDYVYWTADRGDAEGWVLMRVPRCGGIPVALAKRQSTLTQLSFNGSRVFVATVPPAPGLPRLLSLSK